MRADTARSHTAIGALFSHDPSPAAALCHNDAVVLGRMAGLVARGRRPGRDFAVIGFDDIHESSICSPSPTTVVVVPHHCGMQAARMTLERLHSPRTAGARKTLAARMRLRDGSEVILSHNNGHS